MQLFIIVEQSLNRETNLVSGCLEAIEKKFPGLFLEKFNLDIETNLVPSVNGRINALVTDEQRDRFYARKLFEMTLVILLRKS